MLVGPVHLLLLFIISATAHECPSGGHPDDDTCSDATSLLQSRGSSANLEVKSKGASAAIASVSVEETAWGVVTTTADATGVSLNAEGDLTAFLAALILNSVTCAVFVVVASYLRRSYPIVYYHNVIQNMESGDKQMVNNYDGFKNLFGWITPSLNTSMDDITRYAGLDSAMLMEFTHLCMKVLAIIGIPMICIMGSMNWAFGGLAAGKDHLSYLSFGNVERESWLYWVHAFCVWGVVFTVQVNLYAAQTKFLERRFKWLTEMAPLRSNTCMVESIPVGKRSNNELSKYFASMLGGKNAKQDNVVESVHVVQDTDSLNEEGESLKGMFAEWLQCGRMVYEAESKAKKGLPTTRRTSLFNSTQVDVLIVDKTRMEELAVKIKKERARLELKTHEIDPINLGNAFVTFKERHYAEGAQLVNYTADNSEWDVSTPPMPSDILWKDFTQDEHAQELRHLLGYALIFALYLVYMPLVIGITNIANVIDMGPAQSVWKGLAPTMGLQIMVAFLPTFLLLIFRMCFTLRADAWAQQKVQIWYFWFQIFFVILATAVGQDVKGFTNAVVNDPLGLPIVFANTMPYATHFYMNFLVLQWVAHFQNGLRTTQLFKYLAFRKAFDEQDAKKMAEPEDQDYYGMGSRCARFTIMMSIGIVYGTLSPPINLLTFINFAVSRLVYGNLLVFTETKKSDLGGVFWVYMLKGLFISNIIYCILMLGVLADRAATWGPSAIVAPTLVYVIWSMRRFDTQFNWEKLPHQDVMTQDWNVNKLSVRRDSLGTYQQPEIAAPLDFIKVMELEKS